MITGSSGCDIIPPLCFADRQAVAASKLAPTEAVLISKGCVCAKESIQNTLPLALTTLRYTCTHTFAGAPCTTTLPARPYTCRRTVRATTAPGKTLHLASAPSGRLHGANTGQSRRCFPHPAAHAATTARCSCSPHVLPYWSYYTRHS